MFDIFVTHEIWRLWSQTGDMNLLKNIDILLHVDSVIRLESVSDAEPIIMVELKRMGIIHNSRTACAYKIQLLLVILIN